MMPDRMGTIGNTQGVSDSSRPKPKKLAIAIQKPPSRSNPAIFDDSSPSPAAGVSDAVLAGSAGRAAGMAAGATDIWGAATRPTLAFCTIGG